MSISGGYKSLKGAKFHLFPFISKTVCPRAKTVYIYLNKYLNLKNSKWPPLKAVYTWVKQGMFYRYLH